MKIKSTCLKFSILTGSLFFAVSCNNSKGDDQVSEAKAHNDQKFDAEKEKTADFLVYAADLSLHQMQLAELATGNAEDPQVKKLAKESYAYNKKALEDLKKIAADRTMTLPEAPSKDHQDDCDKIGKKKGAEFDKEYSKAIMDENEKAIKKFEHAADKDKDEVVRKWAFERLPVLRTDLDFAMSCHNKMGDGGKDTAVVLENKSGVQGAVKKEKEEGENANADNKHNRKKDW